MISVPEAEKHISSQIHDYGSEKVHLLESYGRVLRETISADRPMPPFDRVTMDGICISFDAFEAGRRSFPVLGTVAAGSVRARLEDPQGCLQIMTGAVLANGADTVIRYEDISIADGLAQINVEEVRRGQNVHKKGTDRLLGDTLMKPGAAIGAPEVGVLATVGISQVEVARIPRIELISTGDELVGVDEKPEDHQIRRSNTTALYTRLKQYGGQVGVSHLSDDVEFLKEKIRSLLETCDVLILSGGVSKGKFDYVPEVLEYLGVEKSFHKVAQRPGKPFWFGTHPDGTVVFALPGNPVSSFVCTYRYVIPWLNACLKVRSRPRFACLAAPIRFAKDLTYFAQVSLENRRGQLLATPVEGNGSGDLANMVDADAFMELPRGKEVFETGESYPVFQF